MLKEIDGFNFTSQYKQESLGYLYCINRAGCNKVEDCFRIDRDGTYGYWAIQYVYSGEGILEVDNKHYHLQPGDLFILGPAKPHLYASEDQDKLHLLWIELYGSSTRELMNILLGKEIHVLKKEYTGEIFETLLQLMVAINYDDACDEFEISKMLYGLIMDILRWGSKNLDAEQQKLEYKLSMPISKALDHIQNNLVNNLTVAELACYVGCSASYFNKIFKEAIGITPYRYILIKKIEYAIVKLKMKQVSCGEFAEELGFVDAAHFMKVFKKVTGKNFGDYKQSIK